MSELPEQKLWPVRRALCISAAAAGIFFVAGFILASARLDGDGAHFRQIRMGVSGQDGFAYINPLLGCEATNPNELVNLFPVKNAILNSIDEMKGKGMATDVSVYFDMRDGRWFAINNDMLYAPASLLKVPLMVAALKQAEQDPELLRKKVTYYGRGDESQLQTYPPSQTLEYRREYTMEQLVERMIRYSDNAAMNLLIAQLGEQKIEEVYKDFGVQLSVRKTGRPEADKLPVKSYANFFRTLYNASYLNRSMSEKALGYLAQTDFTGGLGATVTSNVSVAHKFGEWGELDTVSGKMTAELHDCGIIYDKAHPYLLCVMTRGDNHKELEKVIAQIAKEVDDAMPAIVKEKQQK